MYKHFIHLPIIYYILFLFTIFVCVCLHSPERLVICVCTTETNLCLSKYVKVANVYLEIYNALLARRSVI